MARYTSSSMTALEAREYLASYTFTHHISAAAIRIDEFCRMSHGLSAAPGWWSDLDHFKATGEIVPSNRNCGELIALIHSEISEALEGNRTEAPSTKIPGFTNEEEELADALHRIFDYAGAKGLRLGEAYEAKARYNMTREDHKLENRAAKGGKQI